MESKSSAALRSVNGAGNRAPRRTVKHPLRPELVRFFVPCMYEMFFYKFLFLNNIY
jgi:hypothetical protein